MSAGWVMAALAHLTAMDGGNAKGLSGTILALCFAAPAHPCAMAASTVSGARQLIHLQHVQFEALALSLTVLVGDRHQQGAPVFATNSRVSLLLPKDQLVVLEN